MKKWMLKICVLVGVLWVMCGTAFAAEVWDGTVADSFAGGSGTQSDPYLISNGAQLARIEQYPTSCFKLTADIYLNDTVDWESWTEESGPTNVWTPLCMEDGAFFGMVDGNGYTIYGLYISRNVNEFSGVGLISSLGGNAVLRNLTVAQSEVFGVNWTGALVGAAQGATDGGIIIENCHNKGNITVTGTNNGGIVGQCIDAKVIDCSNSGNIYNANSFYTDVDATIRTGGIVGGASTTTIDNCTNNGIVSGYGSQTGGIVGYAFTSCEISGCGNYGDIVLHPTKNDSPCGVGGICGGSNGAFGDVVISKCENHGSVSATAKRVGGIGGEMNNNTTIANCINTGEISGVEAVGGLVGQLWAASLETSYNTGDVFGNKRIGGTAGRIATGADGESAIVRDCYTRDNASEAISIYDGTGIETITNVKALTVAQMGQVANFVGFDFDTVWYSAGDGSYPILRGDEVSVQLGDELQISGYLNYPLTVTADADLSDSCVYVLLVSYKNGKMIDSTMVGLTAGQSGTLDLDDWGTEVRLFALSSTYKPFCNGQTI